MREFFELVNEYPWTTFFLAWGICCILTALGKAIHGPEKIINIECKDAKSQQDYKEFTKKQEI
jgi:hypothetical protein